MTPPPTHECILPPVANPFSYKQPHYTRINSVRDRAEKLGPSYFPSYGSAILFRLLEAKAAANMRVLAVFSLLVAASQAGDLGRGNTGAIGSVGKLSGNFIDQVFGGSSGGSYGGSSQFGVGLGDFGGSNKDIFGGSNIGKSRAVGGGNVFQGGNFGGQAPRAQFGDGEDFQRGTVDSSIIDQHQARTDRRDDLFLRDAVQQEQGAARQDQQRRQAAATEAEKDNSSLQEESKGQEKRDKYQQQSGKWNLDTRRQNDQESRRASGLGSDGEIARSDLLANDGAKALGVRRTAFTNGNLGFEKIDYNFDKDFDQAANERGGYKEVTGRDNKNTQVYTEKQRDHRLANKDNVAFRRADDHNRRLKNQDFRQNALQRQGKKSQYGNADKLQDAAAKKAEDFKTFFDKRDDRIWNADRAKDAAYRGAQDVASKKGLHNKDAIAKAYGAKGVEDNKYYGGAETGKGPRGGPGAVGGYGGYPTQPGVYGRGGHAPRGGYNVGYNTDGIVDVKPVGGAGYDPKVGLQGGAAGSVAALGAPGPGNVRGRLEKSGGDIVNAYRENAIQGDLANQVSNSAAEARANAANQYKRDKGLQDSIQADLANQGRWANQREGFRDARQQGYNGDNAEAEKAGEAVENAFSDSSSGSNLDAADRKFNRAKLNRINQKSNKVDSTQNIHSKKQFYHDKNQGGFNNEGLNYNRKRGNNDFGAQEAAHKEASTKFSDLHQNSKNSRSQRRFDDFDGRHISNGEALFKQHSANNGEADKFARARDNARAHANGFDKAKSRKEFDTFNQANSQQNSRLWDRANRDFNTRYSGNNLGRRTDGAFLFGSLGARGSSRPSIGQSRSAASNLGSPRFGSTSLGLDGGIYTSSNSIPSGFSKSSKGSSGANIPKSVLNAGSTQFGNYW
ncbi:hypothetical protein ElyMa_002086300 [Elysia marginata]|uniref:Uncharacterized protein n=1 Tax=Elysia marginata TaxID=1093978 RepID=A0AAV4FCK9_9GAST|nr:hypothetical protein ElyMa_002086300 [Elysia marginata]